MIGGKVGLGYRVLLCLVGLGLNCVLVSKVFVRALMESSDWGKPEYKQGNVNQHVNFYLHFFFKNMFFCSFFKVNGY